VLLTAGHAPAFPERPLDGPELAPVREALDLILTGHEPFPAVVVDRAWNLVAATAIVPLWTRSSSGASHGSGSSADSRDTPHGAYASFELGSR